MDKIYEEQYENFVGREFTQKKTKETFIFGPINENGKVTSPFPTYTGEYEIEEVLGFVRDNIWIVNN